MILNMSSDVELVDSCQEIINILSSDSEGGIIYDDCELEENSDISTEEESLLRQRIEILENYNSALGRNRARLRSSGKDKNTPKLLRSASKKHSYSSLNRGDVFGEKDPKTSVKKKSVQLVKSWKRKRRHSPLDDRQLFKGHHFRSRKRSNFRRDSSSDSEIDTLKHKRKLLEAIAFPDKKSDNSSLKRRLLPMIKGVDGSSSKELTTVVTKRIPAAEVHCEKNSGNDCTSSVDLASLSNDIIGGSELPDQIPKPNKPAGTIHKPNTPTGTIPKPPAATVHQSIIVECKGIAEAIQAAVEKIQEEITLAPLEQKLEVCVEDKHTQVEAATRELDSSDDDAEVLRQLALNSKSRKIASSFSQLNGPSAVGEFKDPNEKVDSVVENVNVSGEGNDNILGHSKSELEVPKCDPERSETNIVTEQNADDGTDTDTMELRLIALKSAMLKKAMERKRQKKNTRKKRNLKRKRKSLSSIFSEDDIQAELFENMHRETNEKQSYLENEEVDSFAVYNQNPYVSQMSTPLPMPAAVCPVNSLQLQDAPMCQYYYNDYQYYDSTNYILPPMKPTDSVSIPVSNLINEGTQSNDDLDEDEDILRAKLLTSMSVIHSKATSPASVQAAPTTSVSNVPNSENDFKLIIELGESDFSSECEETKNLALMHQKLAQQADFQRSLDLYLKSARSMFENNIQSPAPKETQFVKKHTPVAVKHLPKTDQQEYRELVKRMSELEKIKKIRQQNVENTSKNIPNFKTTTPRETPQNTLKPLTENRMKPHEPLLVPKVNNLAARSQPVPDQSNFSDKQLEISRQKITSQMRVVEELEAEGKGLWQKTESLTAQMRALALTLRGSKLALSNNQKSLHMAHRNLVRMRKQHHILLNRIQTSSVKLSSPTLLIQHNAQKTLSLGKTNVSTTTKKAVVENTKINIMSGQAPPSKDTATSVKARVASATAAKQAVQKAGLTSENTNLFTPLSSDNPSLNALCIPKKTPDATDGKIRALLVNENIIDSPISSTDIVMEKLSSPASTPMKDTTISIKTIVISATLAKPAVQKAAPTPEKTNSTPPSPDKPSLDALYIPKNTPDAVDAKIQAITVTENIIDSTDIVTEKLSTTPNISSKSIILDEIPVLIHRIPDEQPCNVMVHLVTEKQEKHIAKTDNNKTIEGECQIPLNTNSLLKVPTNNDCHSEIASTALDEIVPNISKDNHSTEDKNSIHSETMLHEKADAQCNSTSDISADGSNVIELESSCVNSEDSSPNKEYIKTLVDRTLPLGDVDKCLIEDVQTDSESNITTSEVTVKYFIQERKCSNLITVDQEYISPLEMLKSQNSTDDVQAIFCPFEVGGSCKDPECKYFHPKS